MKSLLRIFRPSRKLLIVLVGILLVNGAAGAAAFYFGLIGGTHQIAVLETPNGLACTDVNLVSIKNPERYWVRKFIRTESSDGPTRIKTALRVARAVYAGQKQKPDLVQVVVLDANGPTLRSDMRGRAIGADVIYTPKPDAILKGLGQKTYEARYFDGLPAANGLFFGQRIELPPEAIATMNGALTETTQCIDPVTVAATKNGEGETGAKHGEGTAKNAKPEGLHGEGEAALKESAASGGEAGAETAGKDSANAEAHSDADSH